MGVCLLVDQEINGSYLFVNGLNGLNRLAHLCSQAPVNRNYKHIGRQDINGGLSMLTAGEFVVTEVLSWDESRDTVYFMGTSVGSPGARHLYSVTAGQTSCLTCEILVSTAVNDTFNLCSCCCSNSSF
jgi:hypothetical protein